MNNFTLEALLLDVIQRLKNNKAMASELHDNISKDTLEEVIDLLIEADYP